MAKGKAVANRKLVAKLMVMGLATVVMQVAACPATGCAMVSMPLAMAKATRMTLRAATKVKVMELATAVMKVAACPAMDWALVSLPLARARA